MTTEAIDENGAKSSTPEEELQQDHDVEAQSSSAEGEQAAEAAHDEEAEKSLLDVIAETVKDSREGTTDEPEASPPSEDQELEPDAEAAATPDDASPQPDEEVDLDDTGFTPAELEALKGKTKLRVEELLAQRKEYEARAAEADVIKQFMAENNISSDEMAQMMGTLAHFNAGDYNGFLNGIQPLMDKAGTALGSKLPDDIQKKVDEGYIDAESAAEMTQQRAATARAQEDVAREQFNNNQAAQEVVVGQMRSLVNEWEVGVKAKDVDYAQKEEQIRVNARSLMAQYGTPNTPEQALQLSKDAYEMTNSFIKKTAPPPRAIKPGPASTSVPNAHAAPKSMLEAVQLGIRQANT